MEVPEVRSKFLLKAAAMSAQAIRPAYLYYKTIPQEPEVTLPLQTSIYMTYPTTKFCPELLVPSPLLKRHKYAHSHPEHQIKELILMKANPFLPQSYL